MAGQPGEAEVEDLHHPVAGDDQVRRLDVPVDDAVAVGLGEAAGDLHGDVQRLLDAQRPTLDLAAQGLAVVEGHGDIEAAVRRISQLQDGAEVGMVEAGRGARLLLEPLARLRIARQLRSQEFEGDGAREPGVPRLVDHPHPAAAEHLQDLEAVHPLAGLLHRRRGTGRQGRERDLEQRVVRVRRGQAPQLGAQRLHACLASVRTLRQGPCDGPFEGRRHAGAKHGHRARRLFEDLPRHLGRGRATEGRAAGHHLIDHRSQRPDVRARIGLLAPDLLGGHVGHGAHHRAGVGDPGLIGELGEAEVDDLHPSVRSHHDVARLDVAVDDPPLVGGCEAAGDLLRDAGRLRNGQRAARDPVAQRFPFA